MPDLDDVLHDVHACPTSGGITCRPGGGFCYPAATGGRFPEGHADVVLVGWNPRIASYARGDLPEYDAWREDGAASLEEAVADGTAWARNVRDLLPGGYRLDDGRVAGTYLWKWPTRLKTGSEGERFYVDRCVRKHFWDELAALRPKLLVTYDREAATFLAEEATTRGVDVIDPVPKIRNAEMHGWALPSDAWGWPMGLLLIRDPRDGSYHPDTRRWARAVADRVMREASGAGNGTGSSGP